MVRNTRNSNKPQQPTKTPEKIDKKLKFELLKNKLSQSTRSSIPKKDANNLKSTTKTNNTRAKDISTSSSEDTEESENLDNQEKETLQDTSSTSFLSIETNNNNQINQIGNLDNDSSSLIINSLIGNKLDKLSSEPNNNNNCSVPSLSAVNKTKDIGKQPPTPKMSGPTQEEQYATMVDLVSKIGKLLLKEDDDGNTVANGKNKAKLGSLTSSEYEKLGMKISEVEAVETHPWLVYCKSHNTKMVDIPIRIAKIEDIYIRKAIMTYVRKEEVKLTLYHKLLLQAMEKEPVGINFTSGSSFLVRLLTYLDNENKTGTVTENGFMLEVNKIDREMHTEEMQVLRKQLQSANQQSSSKSFFSSNASENRKIDKESFKIKYPNYKGYCLDWNISGHCKRGQKCSYRHECLHCLNNGGGNCGKQARECEQLQEQ